MEWNRSEVVALASLGCAVCDGLGLTTGRQRPRPCGCVLRAIFRVCYSQFIVCATREKSMSHVSLEPPRPSHSRRPGIWGRKDEEFIADFCLVARRELTELEYRVFKFHFLLRGNWRLCARRLNVDRDTYFRVVYRIEEKLGRRYREVRPYPLFPLDEYFGVTVRTGTPPDCLKQNRPAV
jgi:hypothetical protein